MIAALVCRKSALLQRCRSDAGCKSAPAVARRSGLSLISLASIARGRASVFSQKPRASLQPPSARRRPVRNSHWNLKACVGACSTRYRQGPPSPIDRQSLCSRNRRSIDPAVDAAVRSAAAQRATRPGGRPPVDPGTATTKDAASGRTPVCQRSASGRPPPFALRTQSWE